MTVPHFSHLVLGSGGMSGMSYLGVIRYFQEHGLDRHVHHIHGVSIGAFFGFLFALGLPVGKVESFLKGFYGDPANTSCSVLNLFEIDQTYGLDKGDLLVAPLKHLANAMKLPVKMSFVEFAKATGKTLTVVATDVAAYKAMAFSVDTTPDVDVFEAIQASMTVPLMFEPVRIKGRLYVDGYLTGEYPCDVHKESSLLAVFIRNTTPASTNTTDIHNFYDYLQRIVMASVFYPKETERLQKILKNVIVLDENPIEFVPLGVDEDEREVYCRIPPEKIDQSTAYGYRKMYEFMAQYCSANANDDHAESLVSTESKTQTSLDDLRRRQ